MFSSKISLQAQACMNLLVDGVWFTGELKYKWGTTILAQSQLDGVGIGLEFEFKLDEFNWDQKNIF